MSDLQTLERPNLATSDNEESITHKRILKAFETMACIVGPKGVVMADLVKKIGISTRTLYRCFPNKSQLVTELIRSWSDDQFDRQQQRLNSSMTPRDRIHQAATQWFEHYGKFSHVFWQQLERDFPDANEVYQHQYGEFLERSRQNLTPYIKPELNADLVLSGLMVLLDHARDESLCQGLNMTQHDALEQMINVWADGALITQPS
jgi:AcrR family transcriptional regulator